MTALEASAAREAWTAPHLRGLVTRLHGLHPASPLPTVERAARRAIFADPDETELARLRVEVRDLRRRLADRDRELAAARAALDAAHDREVRALALGIEALDDAEASQ